MASWTDGPEYAPVDRPAAFVTPDVPALVEVSAAQPAAEIFPEDEPSFVASSVPVPDLRELVPTAAPGRNPNLPFESMSTPMTAIQPEAGPRNPEEPFNAPGPELSGYLPVQPAVQPAPQVNPAPFPAPGTTQWFAPPSGPPVMPAPTPVDISRVWKETTNWVMIPLMVAMFILPASPIALLVSWLSTVQIRYRRAAIRRAYWIALAAIVGISLITVFVDDTANIWDPVCLTSLIASWILVFVTPGLVGAALRNNEPPDRY